MELEDLKTIWRVGTEGTLVRDQEAQEEEGDRRERQRQRQQTDGQRQQTDGRRQQTDGRRQRADRQIRILLGKRSRGLVAKMKRNLLGELLLVLAIYVPAILFYLYEFSGRDPGTGWILLLLLVCFTGYYYRKNKLLNAMQCPAYAIRANLERQVITLRKYIRFYTVAGTILVPVMAVLSFLSGSRLLFHPSGELLPYFLIGPHRWTGFLVCGLGLVVVTVLSYTANVWGMNKLYGGQARKLGLLLEEMDEG